MSTSLPTIPPYPMPRPDELPGGRATWTVDPARAVLLVHDMQRYFLAPFADDAEPVSVLVAHIAALLRRARELGVPVVAYSPLGRGMLGGRIRSREDFE